MVQEKSNTKAHLQKVHDIDVVLPRGLTIEEEEQLTPENSSGPSFFNNYERQRSIILHTVLIHGEVHMPRYFGNIGFNKRAMDGEAQIKDFQLYESYVSISLKIGVILNVWLY